MHCASTSSFSYKMCSPNPANWVTFDDEPLFQSPQKLADNQSSCKPNGLKLNLSSVHESSSRSSSTGSTPLSSPVVDFYLSPGPPSNSPLTTPTRDYPGNPCISKSGIHMLYPIPEWPSNVNPPPSPGICSSLASQKLSSLPLNPSPNDHAGKALVSKSADEGSPKPPGGCEELAPGHFPYFNSDCAFSSPFWKEGCSLSMSPANVSMPKKDKVLDRSGCHPRDKETCHDQKSLNQGSFSYICERLEHLQADSCEAVENTPISSTHAWHKLSLTIPRSLFRSQKSEGWPFMLRIPEKKNMMSSRQWGPIYLSVLAGGVLQMYYEKGLEKPFKEFQLQPQCKLSEPKLESYNVSGKIHTVKIECVSYTEKRRYHPKAEVIHEPEVEQMLKLGTTDYNDFTDFLTTVEEELMKLPTVSRQKRNYEEQEMTLEIVDNFWGKVTKAEGKIVESAVITHIYCLCFVNGGAECFLTLNDLELQKRDERYFDKEQEKKWINILDCHFHNCVKAQEFEQSRIIKFTPPDACRLELMRFRTRYNGQDLPFSVKAAVVVQGAYTELQAFINMSSTAQILTRLPSVKYCENVMIRFPVPTQWIKALWTMNLQRQKSLKAKMNRRACLGALHEVESDPVIQVSVGTAKYESAYRAVVWKIDRLPDKNSSYHLRKRKHFRIHSIPTRPSHGCRSAGIQTQRFLWMGDLQQKPKSSSAWTQVDICYPTFTIQYLPRKIPSSDYFSIPFLRRQNNLLDNSHCYLFLDSPPPKKSQEDSEFAPKALTSMLVAFYHKLTTSNKPFSLRALMNHSPRGRVPFPWPRHAKPPWCCNSCCPPQDTSLVAGTVQPNPANKTESRLSKCVTKLHPGTTMGEGSKSWEPKGAQFRWDGILQCGNSVLWNRMFLIASCCWDDGGFKDGEAHINKDSFHHSGRGIVDQESVSAGETGLDTARGGQQQIMDRVHITEVQRSALSLGLDHPHSLSYKLELGSDQEIPSDWYPFATVQFVVHDTCASGTEVKSLGIESDLQPQKHVVQKAFYNCQVEIEKKWIRLDGEDPDKAGNCLMQ
ncbi:hypothetical protein Nmel_003755 [Mimus melanotis]